MTQSFLPTTEKVSASRPTQQMLGRSATIRRATFLPRLPDLRLKYVLPLCLLAVLVFCFNLDISSIEAGQILGLDAEAYTQRLPWNQAQAPPPPPPPAAAMVPDHALVPLEAHIMSKCPDAQVCLRDLVLPAMQRVAPKVNFTLSYIGTPTTNDGVECMHGAPECMGNILELCAARLYPDPKIYLGFTMCLMRDYRDIPDRDLVEDCALEHGIDFAELNDCASEKDGEGMGMLRESVMRSIDAGVTKSCTIRVNNEIYCIRDGGAWKNCKNGPGVNDLVIAVEKLYHAS